MSELRLARSARELRDELEELIRDDLIGPIGGPEEELEDAPVDRYLLGLLAPRFSFAARLESTDHRRHPVEDDDEDPIAADDVAGGRPRRRRRCTADSGEEGTAEDRPPAVDQLVPSSFGMTFALDGELRELRLTAVMGRVFEADERAAARRDGKPGARVAAAAVRRAGQVALSGSGSLGPFAPDRG